MVVLSLLCTFPPTPIDLVAMRARPRHGVFAPADLEAPYSTASHYFGRLFPVHAMVDTSSPLGHKAHPHIDMRTQQHEERIATCGIRTHDLPLTERVLCQLS